MKSISNDIVIFSGSGHSERVRRIVSRLGLSLAKVTLGHFSNRETSIQIDQSFRNSSYIIQSFHHNNVNDMLMKMLILMQVIVTHSVAIKESSQNCKVLDIGYLFSEAIRRIHYGEQLVHCSLSQLLDEHAIQIVSQ